MVNFSYSQRERDAPPLQAAQLKRVSPSSAADPAPWGHTADHSPVLALLVLVFRSVWRWKFSPEWNIKHQRSMD